MSRRPWQLRRVSDCGRTFTCFSQQTALDEHWRSMSLSRPRLSYAHPARCAVQ